MKHEITYRGKELVDKLKTFPIFVMGAGSLGSNLVLNLLGLGFENISILDRDVVEDHNRYTQPFSISDIGLAKVKSLSLTAYKNFGVKIKPAHENLEEKNINKLLKSFDSKGLILDCFDNIPSRHLVRDWASKNAYECLHIGVNGAFGGVHWNEGYNLAGDAGEDLCDYPLSRNLILIILGLASEALIDYIDSGKQENYIFDLKHKDLFFGQYRK